MSRPSTQSLVLTARGYEVNQEAEDSDFSGDVTVDLVGKATISSGAVTNAKTATVANGRIKGRGTAGSGAPEDLTPAQLAAILGLPSAYAGLGIPVLYTTPEMDLTAAPGTTWNFNTPTLPAGLGWLLLAVRAHNTARDGTITTSATVKVGTNAAHDNLVSTGSPLNNGAVIKNAWSNVFGTPANAMGDASLGPIVVEMVTPATLNTATVFKTKFVFLMCPVNLAA